MLGVLEGLALERVGILGSAGGGKGRDRAHLVGMRAGKFSFFPFII